MQLFNLSDFLVTSGLTIFSNCDVLLSVLTDKGVTMKITLDETDLERMPEALKVDLLGFLAGESVVLEKYSNEDLLEDMLAPRPSFQTATVGRPGAEGSVLVLDQSQALKLVAEVYSENMEAFSADKEHWDIREVTRPGQILKALSYEEEGEAPTPDQLADALDLESPKRLGPFVGSITSAVKRITGSLDLRLYHLDPRSRTYFVHPETREALRNATSELIDMLKNSDGQENGGGEADEAAHPGWAAIFFGRRASSYELASYSLIVC